MTGADRPWPATSPAWVGVGVIGLVGLIWLMTAVVILRGQDWREPVMFAVIGTVCLSAFDMGVQRRPPRKDD